MAEIRQLTADRFEDRMALSQFAFQFEMSQEQLEEARAEFRPESTYGLFDEENRMLSAVTVIPFEAWIQGRKFAMGGVAGVASWPDARRQGGVARLLHHSLERMRNDGQSLSMLAPFSFAFYRKFGYEMTIERKQYSLEARWFPPRRESNGTVRIVEKKMELLHPVYEAFASQYDGTLVRDPEWWERRVLKKDGIAAAYYNVEGVAEGYILYQVKDRQMKVHEWVAVTEDARLALWSFAGNHDSMAEQLTVTVPADDPLPFLLPEPRMKQEMNAYFMSRIVDAEAFVGQYPFVPSTASDEVMLTIEDAQAQWNRGQFRLSIEADGSARLKRVSEGTAESGDGVSCNIATLTALLVGGRRPGMLQRVGRLQGTAESVAILERRVPKQNPYLADFF